MTRVDAKCRDAIIAETGCAGEKKYVLVSIKLDIIFIFHRL